MIHTSSVLPTSEGCAASLSTAPDTTYPLLPLRQPAQATSLMDSVAALPPALAPARSAATLNIYIYISICVVHGDGLDGLPKALSRSTNNLRNPVKRW